MKHPKIDRASLAVTLLGMIFCVLSAFEVTDALCVTRGCAIYRDFSLWGISLYWFGALAFTILLTVAVTPYRHFFNRVAAIFVLLDIPLLIVQILLWPCIHCLIVALFFGLILFFSRTEKKWMHRLFGLWLMVFFATGISAAKDSLSPWPIYGDRKAPIHLYFSPSCPSCHAMLDALLEKNENVYRIALYPIAKSASDIVQIHSLEKCLKEGLPIQMAVKQYQKEAHIEGNGWAYYRIQFHTFRNLMCLSRYGAGSVPFLITQTPFWQNVKPSQSVKDDCPVFSKNPQGVCVEEQSGSMKQLFESQTP